MQWEESSVNTPIKCQFLKAFFAREKRFFLTGGSALGLFYLDHRLSYDLDFFTPERLDWLEIDGVIRMCVTDLGGELEMLRDSPTFRRYRISRGTESEIIDFVLNICPQIDEQKCWVDDIQVDTLREIMINKITTLVSRCEMKDLVDLYFLEKEGLRIEDLFVQAQQKDGGLDPAMIMLLLRSVTVEEVPEYVQKPLSLDELRAFLEDLKKRMAAMAYPE